MAETVVPAPGLEHRGTGEYRKHNQHSTRFPRCNLYGCTIVDRFPSNCPLAAANPLTALLALCDAAWRHLHSSDPGLSDALHGLACVDVCSGCIDLNLAHPVVKRLRRAARNANAPPVATLEDLRQRSAAHNGDNGRQSSAPKRLRGHLLA